MTEELFDISQQKGLEETPEIREKRTDRYTRLVDAVNKVDAVNRGDHNAATPEEVALIGMSQAIGEKTRSTKTASKGGIARNEPYRLAEQKIIKLWKRGVYDSITECVREEIEALRKYKPGLEKLSVRKVEDWLRNYEKTK